MMESDTPKGRKVPVSYQAVVWLGLAALRRGPDAMLEIAEARHRDDVVNIVAEQDGFCQLDNGLWIFQHAIKKA